MRPTRLAAVFWLLACSVGCDYGDEARSRGPDFELLSLSPRDGEGLDCDGVEGACGVAANRPLVMQFSRWLLPSTATRQSIQLRLQGTAGAIFTEPEYELLTRTVTYRAHLVSGLTYELELLDAATDESGWGYMAYDGSVMKRRRLSQPVLFHTGSEEPRFARAATPAVRCSQVLKAFESAGCTAASCHRSGNDSVPAARLALDSRAGLENMLGKVARATDRGGTSGDPAQIAERFGVNMPLLTPSQPATSFLLYRMLLSKQAYQNDRGKFEVTPPRDAELTWAAQYLGAPGPMPPASTGYPAGTSPVAQVRLIETWIREGADTRTCEP